MAKYLISFPSAAMVVPNGELESVGRDAHAVIDEYEFVVQPRLAGHGPTLFAGLSKRIDLKLVSRLEFGSGAVAMRYEPRR